MSSHRPWGSLLRRLVGVLGLVLLMWGQASAWAQNRITDKAFWTDTTGMASFDQARSARYTPYDGVLSKGFSKEAQWVELDLKFVDSLGQSSGLAAAAVQ